MSKQSWQSGYEITSVGNKAPLKGLPVDVTQVVTSFCDLAKEIEHEKTRREEIIANREVMLAKVSALRDVALSYLDKSFSERKIQFEKLFNALDKALDSDNAQNTLAVANAIVEVAKNNPLKDLLSISNTRKALSDPDKTWEM